MIFRPLKVLQFYNTVGLSPSPRASMSFTPSLYIFSRGKALNSERTPRKWIYPPIIYQADKDDNKPS
ncbi:hypothetical protein D6867_01745 [Streptococcus pseudopneumoniae]|uniref:Uncharacterized protein n=1 Tax=Streptococcus pseudopneumoniae TaxID=257758 RepID=A0ABX9PBN9_9STRE|nr:hypothetical protein D6867_01745 [Streptococcus pseudopneumoniae]